MLRLLSKLKERAGELWWYSALLFVGQRFGDLVNLYAGMIYVPRHVPQEELGAVLPLQQAAGVAALPLSFLALPLMKFLADYSRKGEQGKVKGLLLFAFGSSAALGVIVCGLALALFPLIYGRVRVENGSLTLLLLFGAFIGAFANIANSAALGAKKFACVVFQTTLGGPLRLAVFAVAMPFRPLSGYFLGQVAPPCLTVGASLWSLRHLLSRKIKAVACWKTDARAMLRYALPLVPWTAAGTIGGMLNAVVVRRCLPDFESAGYYIITRFAEIAPYIGACMTVFLFPLAAEGGEKAGRYLRQSFWGSLLGGLCVAAVLLVFGRNILAVHETWRPYVCFAGLMALCAAGSALATVANCVWTFEMARARFGFLYPWLVVALGGSVLLYCWTGCDFFRGVLPECLVNAAESARPRRIEFVVWFLFVQNAAQFVCALPFVFRRRKSC